MSYIQYTRTSYAWLSTIIKSLTKPHKITLLNDAHTQSFLNPTKIDTLFSLAYRGSDTLISAPRFWHPVFSRISEFQHPDPCTKGFNTLFSLAYRGYNTLIHGPRFQYLVHTSYFKAFSDGMIIDFYVHIEI